MNAISLSAPLPAPDRLRAELFDRQPVLARYGLALLGLAVVGLALQQLDPRTVDGVNVWLKPTKFLVSIGVFALTAAWFFGYVRAERRQAPLMRGTVATLIAAGSFELAWIAFQASQGVGSHFNLTTAIDTLMYGLMGLFALLLTGTALPLAWEIARRPAPGLRPEFVAAVAIGLVLTFLLGSAAGAYMSARGGHSVGAEGGHVPLFGWNRSGGDLRIAHFLGIHAEHAIPLLGAVLGLTRFSTRTRIGLLLAGTLLFMVVTLGLLAQAVAGKPLLPL